MATRGAKPKPAALRLITGTHRRDRHGPAEDIQIPASTDRCPIDRPRMLKGDARKAWDEFITPCWWIDQHKVPAAIAFCHLWAEFLRSPENFNASRHGRMHAYMAELGLTDERQRPPPKKSDDPNADFF